MQLLCPHPLEIGGARTARAKFRDWAEKFPDRGQAGDGQYVPGNKPSWQYVWQQANELHMCIGEFNKNSNQPLCRAWRGFDSALLECFYAYCEVVAERHAANPDGAAAPSKKWRPVPPGPAPASVPLPPWVADQRFVDPHRKVLKGRNPVWWSRVPGFEDVVPGEARYLWPCACGACQSSRTAAVRIVGNACVAGQWRLLEPTSLKTSSKSGDHRIETPVSPLVDPRVGSTNVARKYDWATVDDLKATLAAATKRKREKA